jgi:hypothetical protein
MLLSISFIEYKQKGIPIYSKATIAQHDILTSILCSSIGAVWPETSGGFHDTSRSGEIQEITDLLIDAFGKFSRVELGESSHFRSISGAERLALYRIVGYAKDVYPIMGETKHESPREIGVVSIKFSLSETSIKILKVVVYYSEDMKREWKPTVPRELPRDQSSIKTQPLED